MAHKAFLVQAKQSPSSQTYKAHERSSTKSSDDEFRCGPDPQPWATIQSGICPHITLSGILCVNSFWSFGELFQETVSVENNSFFFFSFSLDETLV